MNPVEISLVFHAHQPWGNLPEVVRRLTGECYRPFIEALLRAPHVRCGWHVSGPLLMWWEHEAPEVMEDLKRLTARGQIEWLVSGLYEPILSAWSSLDRRAQIKGMRAYLQKQFGAAKSDGLWLTERVWDPSLIRDLRAESVRYTWVDDHLPLSVGWRPDELRRPLWVESGGEYLTVLPIMERLRYAIPFQPLAVLDALREEVEGEGGGLLVYGDDMEKFGAWPGTADWVFEKGWLAEWFAWLKGIPCVLPGEAVRRWTPRGPCYLPTGSYREMGEWALPPEPPQTPDRQERRSGVWGHFLVRYSEANWLHKKVMALSLMARGRGERRRAAQESLMIAQGNDTYWHGIFGGLYYPHLRRVMWRHVCRAEQALALARPQLHLKDLDGDGEQEAWLKTSLASATVKLREGDMVDFLPFSAGENVFNVLTRRPERYHREWVERKQSSRLVGVVPSGKGVASIHDRSLEIPQSPDVHLIYDRAPKRSAVWHLWPFQEDVTPQAFEEGQLRSMWSPTVPWEVRANARRPSVILSKIQSEFTAFKTIELDAFGQLVLTLACQPFHHAFQAWSALEWNVDTQPGDRWRWIGEESEGEHQMTLGERGDEIHEAWSCHRDVRTLQRLRAEGGSVLTWRLPHRCTVWWQPLLTWSQSEKGLECTLQGATVICVWRLTHDQSEAVFLLAGRASSTGEEG